MFLTQGSSEQALVDLINENNDLPVNLAVGDLYYGKPRKNADGTVDVPTVTMYNNEEYEGYVTFKYKRFNFNTIFGQTRPSIRDLGQNSLHGILPLLNKRLGLNLQERDIVNQQIEWIGGNEQANLNFVAEDNSLGYEGNFVVKFERIRPLLGGALADIKLGVLKHPDVIVPAKKSLSMCTWGIDFTEDAKKLGVYAGYWSNVKAVQDLMLSLGFANFPVPQRYDVAIYSTANIPEANKAFGNVIIQKNVSGPDYAGSAYFHFN